MKKYFFSFLLPVICISILLFSCHQIDRPSGIPVTDTIPVTLMPLGTEGSDVTFAVSGVFTTDDETLLSFKNGGIIERIYVREGDPVKRGQVLARVQLDEVNAKVAQASLALEKAERDYTRARKLYYDSVATLEQMENAKTALDLAQQDMKTMQFNQEHAEIRSTGNGYVLARLAQEGQIVGPGTPVLQINGADDENWQLKVGVSDRQWSLIHEGDSARIATEVLGDGMYAAVVRKKSKGLDPTTGTFNIFLALVDKPAAKIATGMFGKAYIPIQSEKNSTWRIPYGALLEGDGKEGYVFVTDDQKTARKVKIHVASIHAEEVLVSSGLENAEALVVSGSPYLVDGSPIKVVEQ